MTAPRPRSAVTLDTAFFRRWLDRATEVIAAEADHLTELDAAIGDADHGVNLTRGFTAATATVAATQPTTPGAVLSAFGGELTSTVGGAAGPLYGTWLRRAGRALGDAAPATPEALGAALAAGVAGVCRLGDSGPGDKTMVDALNPAAEAYAAALGGGAEVTDALAAAARSARSGAEATIPLRARRGRASYLGERSIGHQDPGAASSALLITALYETAEPERGPAAEATAAGRAETAPAAGAVGTAPQPEPAGAGPVPWREQAAADAAAPLAGADVGPRVGVVLVTHSRELSVATADLAKALVGTADPAPVAAAGGSDDGGLGTSATLIRGAVKRVDAGAGVVVLCDMGSSVLTVKSLLTETGADALPEHVSIADAPFVEGAVAALATASAGGDLEAVLAATADARAYHKV